MTNSNQLKNLLKEVHSLNDAQEILAKLQSEKHLAIANLYIKENMKIDKEIGHHILSHLKQALSQ